MPNESTAPPGITSDLVTGIDRKNAAMLIVESDFQTKNTIRNTLTSLGIAALSDAADHSAAIRKMEGRHFTHLLFEAKRINIPVADFLSQALERYPSLIAIPTSFEPTVDDVFNLLTIGARGYLVKPFTTDSLDLAITMASRGDSISESILHAKDRNEALASLCMTALDKLVIVKRQALQFETAKREVPRAVAAFRRAAEIAKTFAKDGDDALLEAIMDFCIDRANGPASRLGRLRKRLEGRKSERVKSSDNTDTDVLLS